MCERCADVVVELQDYGLAEPDAVHVLWEWTSFPFGDADEVRRQAFEWLDAKTAPEPVSDVLRGDETDGTG